MTQIVVTLDDNANTSLLKKMIDKMKGVLHTSVLRSSSDVSKSKSELWMQEICDLKKMIDTSKLDLNDERTQYILSK